MPNIKSAKKRVRITAKKTLRNKILKSNLKTALKRAFAEESSIDSKKKAIELVDKAVTKGIIHKNNAARKKSAIARTMKS